MGCLYTAFLRSYSFLPYSFYPPYSIQAVIALASPGFFRYTLPPLSKRKPRGGFFHASVCRRPDPIYDLPDRALGSARRPRSPAGTISQLDPEQIKAALHTTKQEEQGFVDRTVAMVKAGKLPREMFVSCFIWARKKPRHKFQYFKSALTTRAAAIGINL